MDNKVEERVKDQELSQNTKITQAIASEAAKMIHLGKKRQEVSTFLATKGLNDIEARDLINGLAKALQAQYMKGVKSGILWVIGGGALTAFTYYKAASTSGGGHYLVAWGAVIFGLFDIVRGLMGYYKTNNY